MSPAGTSLPSESKKFDDFTEAAQWSGWPPRLSVTVTWPSSSEKEPSVTEPDPRSALEGAVMLRSPGVTVKVVVVSAVCADDASCAYTGNVTAAADSAAPATANRILCIDRSSK